MLPTEAVRPLYRRAVEEAGGVGKAGDPLALLVSYCERLLPLPPFEVWAEDRARHPVSHLHDIDESADAPTASDPATMEGRLFEYGGGRWIAHLRCFRDAGTWRGFIAFEERDSGSVHRTALVFSEPGPAEVRERFLSFESATLEAFLRSALP
jgi:hypothetical protein